MVQFKDDRYIIEVYTGCRPAENWATAIKQLASVINSQTSDTYEISKILENMLPSTEQAQIIENFKPEAD